jgi:hypothetical protein
VPGDKRDSTSDMSIVDASLDRVGEAFQALRGKTDILRRSDRARNLDRR